MMSARIEWIAERLAELGAEALIVALPSQVLMLTGYWPIVGTAIAIVTLKGETYLIAPEDEAALAMNASADTIQIATLGTLERPTSLVEDIAPYLKKALKKLGITGHSRIAIDLAPHSEQMPYVAFTVYGNALQAIVREALPNAEFIDAHELLWNAVAVLTATEIEIVRRAAFVARQAYERGTPHIQPGVTEIAASLAIQELLTTCGLASDSGDRAFGHIACMSGKNSGSAYGAYALSTRKTIAANELILTHCNSTLGGYWTDVTRTYYIGDPPERVRKMYDAMLKASRAGIAVVKAGIAASDIDKAVRESLIDDGVGDQFKHGTGHGVGFAAIDHRAKPRLRPNSPDKLRAGMVFNIEPGIYFEDFGGMRHCDMVLCSEDSAEVLTPFHDSVEQLIL